MIDSIQNYSILNAYHYENKNPLLSSLDWASAPARRLLGGRDYNLLNLQPHHTQRIAAKVKRIFANAFNSLISVPALLLKLALLPCIWEKKKVMAEAKQTESVIKNFNDAIDKRSLKEVINALKQRPELSRRNDVADPLYSLIQEKIRKDVVKAWKNIMEALSFLRKDVDLIPLTNFAVQKRLKLEDENGLFKIEQESSSLDNLVFGHYRDMWANEKFFTQLCLEALRIKADDSAALSKTKLKLIKYLLWYFSYSSNELQEIVHPLELIKKSSQTTFEEIKALTRKEAFSRQDWSEIANKLQSFLSKLEKHAPSTLHYDKLKILFKAIIDYGNSTYQESNDSEALKKLREKESCIQDAQRKCDDHAKRALRAFHDLQENAEGHVSLRIESLFGGLQTQLIIDYTQKILDLSYHALFKTNRDAKS